MRWEDVNIDTIDYVYRIGNTHLIITQEVGRVCYVLETGW